MIIQEIRDSEKETALRLIWDTFLIFVAPDYSQEGIETFRKFIHSDRIKEIPLFLGAFEGNSLRGVIAVDNSRSHIVCFYVAPSHQGQGVGRSLWEYVLENSKSETFTVNSSPYAVPIYHKLGFADTAAEQTKNGIRFTPMKYNRH